MRGASYDGDTDIMMSTDKANPNQLIFTHTTPALGRRGGGRWTGELKNSSKLLFRTNKTLTATARHG